MSIASAVRRAARLLKQTDQKVVFAESCTGGLVSGAMTAVPGISNYHCGAIVVYRNATKTDYLGIPRQMIDKFDAVSAKVAGEMARRVLERTREADIGVSVTGHLGPEAPADLDGVVFVGIARKVFSTRAIAIENVIQLQCRRADSRKARQRWVVQRVLELLAEQLSDGGPRTNDK
jgi:PncC family amidohydrolase